MEMRPTIHSPWILPTVVFFGLSISGCASVFNPYVTWDRPTPKPGEEITLKDGIDYANDGKEKYKAAIGDQAWLTNSLGVGLIGLGAAALGLGIAGVSGDAITALGLTGAAGFATGTWLSSRPRQSVYIEGIKGLTCAVEAVLPLNFSPKDRAELRRNLFEPDSLDNPILDRIVVNMIDQIGKLKTAIENAETDGTNDLNLIRQAKDELKTTEVMLDVAKSTMKSGTNMEAAIGSVDGLLRSVPTLITKVESIPSIKTDNPGVVEKGREEIQLGTSLLQKAKEFPMVETQLDRPGLNGAIELVEGQVKKVKNLVAREEDPSTPSELITRAKNDIKIAEG